MDEMEKYELGENLEGILESVHGVKKESYSILLVQNPTEGRYIQPRQNF